MKTMIATALTSALLLSSNLALAKGECDKYRTAYDQTYCFSKLFVESDNELNAVYKDLREVINEATRKQLTETQRGWIKYRDQACQPPGEAGTINVDCNYQVNRERTEYLRDRLRECKAGTCRNDMIGQKSWK